MLVPLHLLERCFILFTVLVPNHHVSDGRNLLLPPIPFKNDALALCHVDHMLQISPSWVPPLCIHKYGALHQVFPMPV